MVNVVVLKSKLLPFVFRKTSKFGIRGGSRIFFSRGGGGGGGGRSCFQKIFENFVDLFIFFRSTEMIFRALPKHGLVPVLAKFSAQQAKF